MVYSKLIAPGIFGKSAATAPDLLHPDSRKVLNTLRYIHVNTVSTTVTAETDEILAMTVAFIKTLQRKKANPKSPI